MNLFLASWKNQGTKFPLSEFVSDGIYVFFSLGAVMCMGVTAGAYILTLFAVQFDQ